LSTGVGIALLGGAMASALQRAERDALRARQQAVLIEQTYDSVLVWAWNGPITFWNHGAERLYGFSRAEAQGRISHELLRTSLPGGVGVFVAHLEAALSWEGELEHTTRDGRGIVVDSRMVLIHEGDRAYVIEVNRDITARREAEWALRDVNAQLESRVASRTAKLQAANQELEEFAYAASHDLKAPLRVIDNASRWLEDDLAEHLTAESRETMHLLRGRVKRMEKLLDDLLDYSRIGRTNEDLDSEICTGDALMANILALLAPADKFTVTVSASFADIRVRRMPLQQILMNLVSNAIKHHDKDKGRVDVSVEDRGDHLAFAVRDDGPGIAADFHEQIFKMFQTLKPRDRVEGSGMGLAMVRKNIAAFGGKLRLESAEGTGSVFAFTLPKRQKVRGDDA
jgi:PAS domain S-box-containing protein